MFDPSNEQWRNASPARRREAYYMTLRVHYGLPDAYAWERTELCFVQYPGFFGEPLGPVRPANNVI
jgi:hypothetical protein